MTIKSSIVGATVAVAMAISAGTALARADQLSVPRAAVGYAQVAHSGAGAHAAASPGIRWTADQLQALADAYRAKNPGWRAPVASGVRFAADMTWTSENLDRLANAYAALNPGWIRPSN